MGEHVLVCHHIVPACSVKGLKRKQDAVNRFPAEGMMDLMPRAGTAVLFLQREEARYSAQATVMPKLVVDDGVDFGPKTPVGTEAGFGLGVEEVFEKVHDRSKGD